MLDPQSRQDLEPILLALLGLPLPDLLDLMEWVAARRFPRARREAYEPRERLLLTDISREAARSLGRLCDEGDTHRAARAYGLAWADLVRVGRVAIIGEEQAIGEERGGMRA